MNTGACDDLRSACAAVHEVGGWAHVDGAFGLWASASPAYRHLNDGVELADSWSTDAHKWLNVPYDAAFAIVSRPDVHSAATSYTAPYLMTSTGDPELGDLVLGSSRRARGFTVWAAIQELGRSGVADLVDRCCALARRFADGSRPAGSRSPTTWCSTRCWSASATTSAPTASSPPIQRDGTCWMGGTTWHGRRLMRIAVSNWSTTEDDVDRVRRGDPADRAGGFLTMARYVIDAPTLLHLLDDDLQVDPGHQLVAPSTIRSEALQLLAGRRTPRHAHRQGGHGHSPPADRAEDAPAGRPDVARNGVEDRPRARLGDAPGRRVPRGDQAPGRRAGHGGPRRSRPRASSRSRRSRPCPEA